MTLLSRVAGLARDMAVGAAFGTGAGADAFFVAFRIPNLLRRMVAEGAASAAVVPALTRSLIQGGPPAALRAAGAVGGAALLAVGALTLVGMAAAGPLTVLFAPGFAREPEKLALTVELTRWTFPYLWLVGGAAWAMGVLHTFRRFALPALGPVLLNLSIIASALWLAPRLSTGEHALVAGVLVGGLLQFLVQVPALHLLGMRPGLCASLRHPAVAAVGRLIVPVLLGGAVYQVNVLVATVFASLLPDRSVSYLWYADRVFEFPLGIVAVAVGTAALPTLASQARKGETEAMADTVVHSLCLVFSLCLPAAIGLAMLAPDIVALLFERGRFTTQDVGMTAWALRAYAPGLLGVAAVRVLAAAFYAVERPRAPVYAACLALGVNVVFDLALMGPVVPAVGSRAGAWIAGVGDALRIVDLRHAGLALATGIAATVNAGVLLALLLRRMPELRLSAMGRSVAVHLAAAAAMAATLAALPTVLPVGLAWAQSAPGRVVTGIAAGSAVYIACALALGSRELRELIEIALELRGGVGGSVTRGS